MLIKIGKKNTLFVLIGLGLIGCGGPSGKGGMPTSIEEHVNMVCQKSWANGQDSISNATGQQKDILKERIGKLSESKLCECTMKLTKLGEFTYKNWNGSYNDYINDHRKDGSLQSMYDSFKKYKLEETLPIIQVTFDGTTSEMFENYSLCVEGIDPDSKDIKVYE